MASTPMLTTCMSFPMAVLMVRTLHIWIIIKCFIDKSFYCFIRISRDEKSRTFSSNSKRSHILRTSSRSRRLILSSIVSFAVWLKWTRTIYVVLPICFLTVGQGVLLVVLWVAVLFIQNPPVNEKCPVTVNHRAVSV